MEPVNNSNEKGDTQPEMAKGPKKGGKKEDKFTLKTPKVKKLYFFTANGIVSGLLCNVVFFKSDITYL